MTPWRRISTIQFGPSAFASERPSSGLTTSRLVSPNSSRLSQNGAFVADLRAHVIERLELLAGVAERQERHAVMVRDRVTSGRAL